jgi:hypothetical protein
MATFYSIAETLFRLGGWCVIPFFLVFSPGFLAGSPRWLWAVQAGFLVVYGTAVVFVVRSRRLRPVWKGIVAALLYCLTVFCSNWAAIEICGLFIQ